MSIWHQNTLIWRHNFPLSDTELLQDILGLAFVRRHLIEYEKHILKYVNVKQRESFVASLAQYVPEHSQVKPAFSYACECCFIAQPAQA